MLVYYLPPVAISNLSYANDCPFLNETVFNTASTSVACCAITIISHGNIKTWALIENM